MTDYTVVLSTLLMLADPGGSLDVEMVRGVDVPTSCIMVNGRVECLAVIPAEIAGGDVFFHDEMRCAILATPISASVGHFDRDQGVLSDLVLRDHKPIVITGSHQDAILTARTDAPRGTTTVSYIIPADALASGRSGCYGYY